MTSLNLDTKQLRAERAAARKAKNDSIHTLSLRIEGGVYKYLSDRADKEERTVSYIIRDIILNKMKGVEL